MYKPIVFLFCLVWLAGCANSGIQSDSASRSIASVDSDANRLVDQMAAELGTRVQTTKNSFAVFHYEHAAPHNTWERFRQSVARFWIAGHYNPVLDTFGHGMYVSADPISTENFGKPDFDLFMINLKPGTRYLSLNTNAIYYSEATAQALQAFGCGDAGRSKFGGLIMMLGESSANCRNLALNVIRKLDIDALYYPFATIAVTGCKTQKSAFLILRTDHVAPNDVKEFTEKIPHPDPLASDRHAIERLARNQMATLPKIANGYSLWPKLEVDPNDQDMTWAKENLFLCEQ